MEITTKERYFYITTMPLVILGLLFLVIKYAPWSNPNKICEPGVTKIVAKKLDKDYEDSIFKIGEPVTLNLQSNGVLNHYNWFFGKIADYEVQNGSKNSLGNIVKYNKTGKVNVDVRLNKACTISKQIEIINNCEDGIKNGDETGIDCGGSVCRTCEVVKKERKQNPLPKKDIYRIKVDDTNMKCGNSYTFTCINISKNDKIENDIYWVFDMMDTDIKGNPNVMKFTNKQRYVNHAITAFKKGRPVATKRITVKCDDI